MTVLLAGEKMNKGLFVVVVLGIVVSVAMFGFYKLGSSSSYRVGFDLGNYTGFYEGYKVGNRETWDAYQSGISKGNSSGYALGYDDGYADGLQVGGGD